MKAATFIAAIVIVFIALLCCAFAWDSARLLRKSHANIEALDRELASQEDRIIQTLSGLPSGTALSPELRDKYRRAGDAAARRRIFNELLAVSRPSLLAVDPTNPLARRFADEAAGAINRWQIIQNRFEQSVADYNTFAQGTRGEFGRRLTGLPEKIIE